MDEFEKENQVIKSGTTWCSAEQRGVQQRIDI